MQRYYEVYESRNGGWKWKVYHSDPTGHQEIIDGQDGYPYSTKKDAIDACSEWMDENDIDADLA